MPDERERPDGLLDAVEALTEKRKKAKAAKEKKQDDLDLGRVW